LDNVYLIAAAWVGLALLASLVSIRLGISVALVEIVLGVVGGNFLGLGTTSWIDFLALFGSVLLTFLAGAEIDPGSLRRHLGRALAIGAASFALPALARECRDDARGHADERHDCQAGEGLQPFPRDRHELPVVRIRARERGVR